MKDLKSLHGTYQSSEDANETSHRLEPFVDYKLNSGDKLILGKEVYRDFKVRNKTSILLSH